MNKISSVDDLQFLKILFCDIGSVEWNIIGDLARRSLQKYGNSVQILKNNSHIWEIGSINAVLQSFRCPNCDTIFSRAPNSERH